VVAHLLSRQKGVEANELGELLPVAPCGLVLSARAVGRAEVSEVRGMLQQGCELAKTL
jgi:hypothetical protein